ncbi:MerR family DNA-binding transcriptional regulator [Streptomyces tendae]|uniref:MerR family DNA-binding transcriptional regulator n=1 Tax=Streptomyces tendae TaxID=1932 RepID=UPI00371FAB7A
MQISELARRAGVTTKAVRYYESLGLLAPGRLANGYRDSIDELTQRIEGLTARRAVLVAHLQQATHRGSHVSPADEGEDLMTDYTSVPADLPVPEDDGAAAHLPGTKVPRLELQGTGDAACRLDALGAGRTVVYIYPLTGRPGVDLPDGWDSIPGARGCTPEACGIRDHYPRRHDRARLLSDLPPRTSTPIRSCPG